MSQVPVNLTPTQRMLLVRLLTTELVRARAAASAAGACSADLDAAVVHRCGLVQAMINSDEKLPDQ